MGKQVLQVALRSAVRAITASLARARERPFDHGPGLQARPRRNRRRPDVGVRGSMKI
jgi:hypothetical protein